MIPTIQNRPGDPVMKKVSILRNVCLLVLLSFSVSVISAQPKDATFEVEVRADVKIPMRDGVNLSANIFLPKAEEKFPVLLTRTPYGKGDEKLGDGLYYGAHGYVVVSQDCRGKGASEGEWEPFMNETPDGHDTLKWILKQPWSNGTIGSMGGSYVGFTQWMEAPGAGQFLKAMFPVVPMVDPYGDGAYLGGAFQLSLLMGWGSLVSFRPGEPIPIVTWSGTDWDKAYRTLPLSTWDKAIGREVQYLRDWVSHTSFDSYWAKGSVRNRWNEIATPICAVGGWYDIFAKTTLDHVNAVRAMSPSEQAAQHQHVLMGPWVHGMSRDGTVGDLNFGKDSVVDLRDIQTKWFDHWLKGKGTGVEQWAPFRIFVMGRNEWRDEPEWPLRRAKYTSFYLRSSGSANTLAGDGELSTTRPAGGQLADTFVYNPEDPVPTLGGNNLFGCPAGPRDQRKAEERKDVLVYTSAELKEELEVTGPVKAVLYAASTAPDTDWTAKLVDVHPDGRAINLCDGIIRARCRDSVENPTLIEPGEIYCYEIDLWVTSNVFLPGHRIRVEISSSNFPRFDRNPNTGHPFGADAELKAATQTIYHDVQNPSHIRLPIIPGA
jgi:hypothetical protein